MPGPSLRSAKILPPERQNRAGSGWAQNGSKMDPRSTRNGPNIDPSRVRNESIGSEICFRSELTCSGWNDLGGADTYLNGATDGMSIDR